MVNSLNSIVAYDWAQFFRRRLDNLRPEPPAQGLEAAGWHVVYTEFPNAASRDAEAKPGIAGMRYSIGLIMDESGGIVMFCLTRRRVSRDLRRSGRLSP